MEERPAGASRAAPSSSTSATRGSVGSADGFGRRQLLKLMGTCLGAVAGLSVLIPGLGFLFAPLRRGGGGRGGGAGGRDDDASTAGREPADAPAASEAFVEVAKLDELTGEAPLRCEVRQDRHDAWMRQKNVRVGACFVGREAGGQVVAWSTQCPHLGCSIDWSGGHFACPCHDSVFDKAGTRRSGPSPRDMDRLETRVDGDRVLVRYQTFRTGSAKKDPTA